MTISWLHLSDVHECSEDAYHRVAMYEAILDEIKANPPVDFVFFTGDLAFSGTADEYKLLNTRLLTPLRAQLPDARIFTVPGNHDVDRKRAVKPRLWMMDANEAAAFRNVGLMGQQKRIDTLLPRFQAYCDLEMQISGWGENWICSQKGAICKVMDIRGRRIAVVGINTAWLCQDDEDWGNLTAGRTFVDAALIEARRALTELVIVLGHHPLAAMTGERKWSDGNRIRLRLEQANAVYLHGHLHASGAQRAGDSMQSVLAVQAPSGFQVADSMVWRNGLMFGTVDFDARRLFLTPKRWNDDYLAYVFDSDAASPKLRTKGEDSFFFSLPGPLGNLCCEAT